jgi:hypothetical protein
MCIPVELIDQHGFTTRNVKTLGWYGAPCTARGFDCNKSNVNLIVNTLKHPRSVTSHFT